MTSARTVCAVLFVCSLVFGCSRDATPPEYVARVGDQFLTEADISAQLDGVQHGLDAAEARAQIIEQWVTNTLLYQEAERRGLRNEPAVQQRLREQERSVLINELTSRLYAAVDPTISAADVRAYYEQHQDQLRLREPYVRVRYLAAATLDGAESVQAALRARRDSTARAHEWRTLTSSHAVDPQRAASVAAQYYPERHLFSHEPILQQQLGRLQPGETAPILEIGDHYHVMHLVDRAAPGTIPQPAWVESEIRRRLAVRARKQMYAREVERLRNEALARREVDIVQ